MSKAAEAQPDWRHRRLLADLERRLMLSARLSDALFGFTAQPAPFPQRLEALAHAVTELLGDADQSVDITVTVQGTIDTSQASVLLRLAHEMVGNAVLHGLRARLVGRIQLSIAAGAQATVVAVRDDGWGPRADMIQGGGTAIMRELAGETGMDLTRTGEWTTATARLARPRRRAPSLMAVWPMLALLPAAAILTSWYCGVL